MLLEHDRFYVGITKDVQKRYSEHYWGKAGAGAGFTKKYRPIEILEIYPTPFTDKMLAQEIENNKTIELLKKYGIDRVRGGEFCECDTKYLIRMMPQNLVDEITEVSL